MADESVQIRLTGQLNSFLGQFSQKYIRAANQAARKAAFYIYGICQKDYLSVVDGESRRTKTSRPTPRTTQLGLRRPTGNLARNVKVGVYSRGSLTIINAATSAFLKEELLDGAAVGIGDNVMYGVYQERGGNEVILRKDGLPKFHPFLAPAFDQAEPDLKRMFDEEFAAAERSKS